MRKEGDDISNNQDNTMSFGVDEETIGTIQFIIGMSLLPGANKALAISEVVKLLRFNFPSHQLDFVDALKGGGKNRFFIHMCSISEEGQDLIWSALEEGCRSNDWSSLLAIDTLFRPIKPEECDDMVSVSADWEATARSWEAKYIGFSHELLWEHICRYYRTEESQKLGSRLYANMCAVVQSSGMGKSRAVYELGKTHFLIPVILRKGKAGFPPPDHEVRDFLINAGRDRTDSPGRARERCIGFLSSLFRCTLLTLKEARKAGFARTKAEMIMWFYSHMSPPENNTFRKTFFENVIRNARNIQIEIAEKVTLTDASPATTSSDSSRCATLGMIKAAEEVVKFIHLANDSGSKPGEVQVVLAFDEAHVLTEKVFDTSTGKDGGWSLFTLLRDCIRALYGSAIWTLFLSTDGKLSQFNPHRTVDPSGNQQDMLVPPFTTLRYDLYAPRLIRRRDGSFVMSKDQTTTVGIGEEVPGVAGGGILTLKQITNTSFIVQFGRPLFALAYENGLRDQILRLAMDKLICGSYIESDSGQRISGEVEFACLSKRLCLEFDSTAYNDDEDAQIAAHMRVCLKIGRDCQYIVSLPGSEPLLAEAAASLMMRDDFEPAESLKRVLTDFSIHKGDQGKLVSMLALTVARDSVVRRILASSKLSLALAGVLPPRTEAAESLFRSVKLPDFLEELFALGEEAKLSIREDFKNTYIYFNHFVKPFTQGTCTPEFLAQYLTRGAAILCANNMPGVNLTVPTLASDELITSNISAVVVQSKLDGTITRARHGKHIFKSAAHGLEVGTFRGGRPCKQPLVRIVFSLRSKLELWYKARTITLNGQKVRTHDFWCGGIGPHFLPGRKESDGTWLALVSASEKMSEVVDEGARFERLSEERMSLVPGGSDAPEYWSWVECEGDESMGVDEDESSSGSDDQTDA